MSKIGRVAVDPQMIPYKNFFTVFCKLNLLESLKSVITEAFFAVCLTRFLAFAAFLDLKFLVFLMYEW